MAEQITQDVDGNIINCRTCGSRAIRKFGFLYRAKSKKQQWMCNNCGKRTVRPNVLERASFITQDVEPEFMPIDQLIEHREKNTQSK